MSVPNNYERIVSSINAMFGSMGARASVSLEDSRIVVNVASSSVQYVHEVAHKIERVFGTMRIGDGHDELVILIDAEQAGVYEELALLA